MEIENNINLHDYVKVQEPKDSVNDSTKWLYGKVTGFESGGNVTLIHLTEPWEGVIDLYVPSYMVKPSTKYQSYSNVNIKPVETGCKHEWINTGTSPLTNKTWYNCSKCHIAKEKA